MSRRTIFVLGMGRSGTSTVAAVLRSLGVEWGADGHMMPPKPDNPAGFWEFTPLYEINLMILQRFNSDWHSPPVLPEGWEKLNALDDLKSTARHRIAGYFRTGLWGFKDPRCCLTLPFWKCVIDNPIDCIIPVRNPLEVAASLLRRDQTPIARGLWLWQRYVKWAWRASKGLRRHVLEYESLLENPVAEAKKIQAFVGLPADDCSKAAGCIVKGLKHEQASMSDFMGHVEARQSTRALYAALVRVARGGDVQEVDLAIGG